MHPSHTASSDTTPSRPVASAPDLGPAAVPTADENALATLQVDLDARMHFTSGQLVLDRRSLHARVGPAADWHSWPLQDGLALRLSDHGGVGLLELHDGVRLLAQWRFTLGLHAQAARLLDQFERRQAERALGEEGAPLQSRLVRDEAGTCPTCAAPLPDDSESCPVCQRELQTPPSTWVLLRLARFAKPYQGQLLAGFLLTLASTAATLVPPYLTMPLMDEVLIPYQNGEHIDIALVAMYLGGLLAAALAAWGLGWARTYLLALVSERIGADLRTTTFEHLLRLSLDYFGGKRTGDLMARIGSETDRINVFLSLHALDFATDVLMIGMTAVILLSINPWLALVTLLPLPVIAWMIHFVREKLRTGWTTGACATAAVRAATLALLTGKTPKEVEIQLPGKAEKRVPFALHECELLPDGLRARAVVVKDAGDDPDVTHGALVLATIRPGPPGSGVSEMRIVSPIPSDSRMPKAG